ncbi:MAG: hypothetical protein J6S63_01775 [Atopobiaceae bacterium]|nr:hypothetical protein [Atopobiaceae bacterium]
MNNKLFRQKNLDQISNVEELHDYLHVTSPRLWMFLSAIMALIVGLIVYACTITMENTLQLTATAVTHNEDGHDMTVLECMIPDNMADVVKSGMDVRIGADEGTITSIFTSGSDATANVILNDITKVLPEGDYEVTIVLESVSPLSFLLN